MAPFYMLLVITGSDIAPWDPDINYYCPEIARQCILNAIVDSDLPRH